MSKIKLALLYKTTERPWGGVNTFFRNFHKYAYLDEKIELVNNYSKAEIFLSVGHRIGQNKKLRKRNIINISRSLGFSNPFGGLLNKGEKKFIFRLDGLRKIYAPEAGKVDDLLIDNLTLADSAVFQSNYSQECFDDLQINYPESNTIILNGTDNRIFFPSREKSEISDEVILISNSWSVNHNKGFKTIASFSELNRVQVLHIGRWPEDISSKYVKLLGTLRESEIADVLKKGQFFLFPSKNEACPNTVVEALATGLPVFYHDSGGTSELCHNGMLGMALPKDSFDLLTLNEFIESALDQYSNMRKLILEKINLFSFEYCYNKYVEHIWNAIL